MAKKQKRMTLEELRRPDDIQVALKGLWDWIENNWRLMVGVGVVMVVGGGASTVMGDMAREDSHKIADQVTQAMKPLTAPVGDAPAAAPATDVDEERFQDRAAALTEAQTRLATFATDNPGHEGAAALELLSISLSQGDDTGDKLRQWLGANDSSNLGETALHALAEAQHRAGDVAAAIATYTQLAERSRGGLKAMAWMAIGDLQNPMALPKGGDSAMARKAYEQATKALGPRAVAAPGDLYASLSAPYLYAELDARLALLP
ncbi:MAG: hypothetical protein VX938_08015 [Myxococcota bacterium]|nr:hypothetical protein [Myxococcota bacterium]